MVGMKQLLGHMLPEALLQHVCSGTAHSRPQQLVPLATGSTLTGSGTRLSGA